jgi:hypothetical protein
MSFYPPPNEILPIFNPANYDTQGNTDNTDIPFLTGYFTRYPVSQGSQTISGSLVSTGQVTANTNIVMSGTAGTNYLQFPDGTQQTTAGGGGGNLNTVLSLGNTATNKITLNNSPGGNTITIDPLVAGDPTIVLSDGSTTNTINKFGYTTRPSSENQAHYLNFSNSASQGTGQIQKSANFSVNPSTGTFTAGGLVTATGGLTTGTGSVLTSTGTTTLGGATTATGLITANGGLTTGSGSVLTSSGTTLLLETTTATGLITANGGLTTSTLTSSGTTTLGATTATGLITANGGLTTNITSVLTSTGTTTLGGATTANGLITANGGLTMGGAQVITLGTGVTPPTATQLGYIKSIVVQQGATVGSYAVIGTTPDLILGAGVWAVMCSIVFSGTGAVTPFVQLSVNGTIENDDFCPTLVGGYTSCNFENVFHFTGSTNTLRLFAGTLGSSVQVITGAGFAPLNYLRAVRIA